jgi:hypothetical protein
MIKLRDLLMENGNPCWDGYKQIGMKDKGGRSVPNCVKKEDYEITLESSNEIVELLNYLKENDGNLDEASYQGRSVKLNKPMRGDVKKFKVYVKDPSSGNIKKVNFGDPNMRIKKSNPARRKSFRARHHCDTNAGPKTKARYWSCRNWE